MHHNNVPFWNSSINTTPFDRGNDIYFSRCAPFITFVFLTAPRTCHFGNLRFGRARFINRRTGRVAFRHRKSYQHTGCARKAKNSAAKCQVVRKILPFFARNFDYSPIIFIARSYKMVGERQLLRLCKGTFTQVNISKNRYIIWTKVR